MAASEPACHVESPAKFKASITPPQMCQSIREQLAKHVGSQMDLSDIRVILRMDSAHFVEARVTRISDEYSAILPPLAVEVLDRPINLSDIESLANSVGHALLNQKS